MGTSFRTLAGILFLLSCIPVVGSGCGQKSSTGSAVPDPVVTGPVVESFSPDADSTAVAGTHVVFTVDVNPTGSVEYRWTVDGEKQRATGNQFVLGTRVGDSGVRTVRVEVLSDGQTVSLVWHVTLLGERSNNAPVIAAAMPAGDVSVTRGSKVSFSVTATDSDIGDVLGFSWFVDGADQGQSTSWVNLDTSNLSAGTHTVETRISDGEETAAHAWDVTVNPTVAANRNPVIDSAAPQGAVQVRAGSVLNLEVTASDPDGDTLAYRWKVDGVSQTPQDVTFGYQTSIADAGSHLIVVTVYDGVNNGQDPSYTWNVTVVEDAPAQVELVWDPVVNDVAGHVEGVSGYRVYLAEASQPFGSPVSTVSEPLAELMNLERGVVYQVAVSAFDRAGNESQLSQPLEFQLP